MVLSKGKNGEEFWCKATVDLATAPIAVQTAKILSEEKAKYTQDYGVVEGRWYTLQIASATKGGAPIIKNWLLSMTAEADGKPCIRTLYDQ